MSGARPNFDTGLAIAATATGVGRVQAPGRSRRPERNTRLRAALAAGRAIDGLATGWAHDGSDLDQNAKSSFAIAARSKAVSGSSGSRSNRAVWRLNVRLFRRCRRLSVRSMRIWLWTLEGIATTGQRCERGHLRHSPGAVAAKASVLLPIAPWHPPAHRGG